MLNLTNIKSVSVQMVKIEANIWLLRDGTRLPFTALKSVRVSLLQAAFVGPERDRCVDLWGMSDTETLYCPA